MSHTLDKIHLSLNKLESLSDKWRGEIFLKEYAAIIEEEIANIRRQLYFFKEE
jgi:hypothetical protein